MARISGKYAPNISFDASEFAQFEKDLKKLYGLSVKKRRTEMKKVLAFALRPTKRAMIANALKVKKRGVLANSITTVDQKAVGIGSRIGKRTGPTIRGKSNKRAFHAHLVELGTKRKRKTVKPGKKFFRFYSFKNRRWVYTKTINHGSKARPFIKPAWESTRRGIPGRIKEKMRTIFKNLAKNMGK